MTLQQLQYVLAAARHGSFSAAAEALHLAQPSLSEQIRRLEAELGVALFARVGRGVVLTEAGRALLPRAEAALAAADAARASVGAVRELRGGVAAFGTWGTARAYLGADLVADFRARHPDVRVRLLGQNSSETAEAVRTGELEAAVIALPIDDRGLEVHPSLSDEVVFASTDPGRLRADMTIERLAETPLILSEARWGAEDPTRRQLAERAQRAGVRLEPTIDLEDVEVAVALAGRGVGDTIVSRGILLELGRRVPAGLGWVPFAERLDDTFAFVWRRGAELSPAAREFVTLAGQRLDALAAVLRTRPARRRRPRR